MKDYYPQGTTWEARSGTKLYKIKFDRFQSCPFCISITKLDGSHLGWHYHWLHYENLSTLRAAKYYCWKTYFEKLKFRRQKELA